MILIQFVESQLDHPVTEVVDTVRRQMLFPVVVLVEHQMQFAAWDCEEKPMTGFLARCLKLVHYPLGLVKLDGLRCANSSRILLRNFSCDATFVSALRLGIGTTLSYFLRAMQNPQMGHHGASKRF